jgi:hypothetical protein
MNLTESEVMRILAREGYEARIADGSVIILGRSGRELVRIPLEELADDYHLPADLLDKD